MLLLILNFCDLFIIKVLIFINIALFNFILLYVTL